MLLAVLFTTEHVLQRSANFDACGLSQLSPKKLVETRKGSPFCPAGSSSIMSSRNGSSGASPRKLVCFGTTLFASEVPQGLMGISALGTT